MTERKLQFTGGSSFIVSLPKDWVEKAGLKAGSSVHIAAENDGSLRLSPRLIEARSKEAAIEKGTTENTLRRILAAYIAGADSIVVKGKDTAEVCEEARLRLSGLEIVEEQRDRTVMRVLAHEEELNYDVLLKRLYVVSEVLCNLAIRTVSKNEDVKLEAQRRDNDADRLYLLIMRCLYNNPCTNVPMKTLVAKGMERVADHAEVICMRAGRIAPDAVLAALLKDTVQLYSEAFKAVTEGKYDEHIFERHDYLLKQFNNRRAAFSRREHKKDRLLTFETVCGSSTRILERALAFGEMAANVNALDERSL